MKILIFKSDEAFSFMDFSISHKKLLLRATVVDLIKGRFYNIDILFGGTTFIQTPTTFLGLEIYLGSTEEIIHSSSDQINVIRTKYEYYKNYVLVTENKRFHIVASDIQIYENSLNPNISSINKD